MCACEKPNINGEDGYSWDGKRTTTRKPTPPAIHEDEVLVFDEPGRCGGIDSHSHHYCVVQSDGRYELLVRHGGGDERVRLSNGSAVVDALLQLDTNGRYWYRAALNATLSARESVNKLWRTAAAEKRVKTRKVRGQDLVKVWIEPSKNTEHNQ